MRDDYLVRFLLLMLPLIGASSVGDLFLGYSPFSWALLFTGALIGVLLFLIRRGRRAAGIDLFFFGSVASLSAAYAAGILLGTEEAYVLPLLSVVQFAAISIYGLFAGNAVRLRLLFALVALFDAAEWFLSADGRPIVFVNRLGVLALHFAAYGFARFLGSYFDRLHSLAEARRLMNRRLEELVGEARDVGRERLASFSHDIRSPITGIIGVHDLLASTELDEEQRSYLAILAKSNRLLLDMVESMLDGDDDGRAARGLSGAALRSFLDDALAPYRTVAENRGVALRRKVAGNPPPIPLPRADAARIVGNLVDNALKYAECGAVSVTVRTDPGTGGAVLEVADSGRGMDADRLAAVRAGSAGSDPAFASSRGLGLAGVRRIAESVGAELSIDSGKDTGTRVAIRFPLPEAAPSAIVASTIP